jgi:hypothetical protein
VSILLTMERVRGFEFARGKTKGFIKTRVKDSIKPSDLVFRVVGGWAGATRPPAHHPKD